MELINLKPGVGILLCFGVWDLPFRLSASLWRKRVTSYSLCKDSDAIGTVWGQRRNLNEKGRDFLAALPGRFVLGPIPPPVLLRKRGEKARNQACQAQWPLSDIPPPLTSTAGSQLAGTPCLVGGKGRERAGPAASQARGARSCHCGKRASLGRRARSWCRPRVGISGKLCSPTPGRSQRRG